MRFKALVEISLRKKSKQFIPTIGDGGNIKPQKLASQLMYLSSYFSTTHSRAQRLCLKDVVVTQLKRDFLFLLTLISLQNFGLILSLWPHILSIDFPLLLSQINLHFIVFLGCLPIISNSVSLLSLVATSYTTQNGPKIHSLSLHRILQILKFLPLFRPPHTKGLCLPPCSIC